MNLTNILAEIKVTKLYTNVLISDNKILLTANGLQKAWNLALDLSKPFPYQLPEVKLQNPTVEGYLEHVCWSGIVCFNDGEGISIDTSNPINIIIETISQCVILLDEAKLAGTGGFLDEFEGYWNRISPNLQGVTFIDDESPVWRATASQNTKSQKLYIHDGNSGLSRDYGFNPLNFRGSQNIPVFRLDLKFAILPPLPLQQISEKFIRECIKSADVNQVSKVQSLLVRKTGPANFILIIAQPRSNGGVSKFGAFIKKGKNCFFDKPIPSMAEFTPITIKRHTDGFLSHRGGANNSVNDKSVAIIGCGAVGSRIAEYLIMGGIRHIHLQDPDVFSSDNLFRHILDSKWIGCAKVDALKAQLIARFPYIEVTTSSERLNDFQNSLIDYDCVCLAIGNPTVERKINQDHLLMNSESKPQLITTWLEAYGIGGHILMQDGVSKGCFHCLYHRNNTFSLSPINNFIQSGQKITKNLTGCGGAFVPFGALDASKTAELAARKILSSLGDGIQLEKKYNYWQTDVIPLAAKELILTPSFEFATLNKLLLGVNDILEKGCPVCKKY